MKIQFNYLICQTPNLSKPTKSNKFSKTQINTPHLFAEMIILFVNLHYRNHHYGNSGYD